MAAQKRQCANCRFFQDAGMSGNGWCTHPKRQVRSDVRLLVRRGELACRNTWGGDLFSSKDGEVEHRPDHATTHPSSTDHSHPPPLDDEVTSVVTPPVRRSTGGDAGEDRVVSDRPSPRRVEGRGDGEEDDGRNDAARLDQDERARVMARGSGDAIARARARHLERSRRGRQAGGGQKPSDEGHAEDTAPHASTDPVAQPVDDRLLTHAPRPARRFSRRNPATTATSSFDLPVPRSEVFRQPGHQPSADRYDSVPDVDPDFDLPTRQPSREPSRAADSPQPETPSSSRDAESEVRLPELTSTSYEHVLSRARRIRESKRAPRPHRTRFEHHALETEEEGSDDVTMQSGHVGANHDFQRIDPAPVSAGDSYGDLPELDEPGQVAVPSDSGDFFYDEWTERRSRPASHRGWLAQLGISRRERRFTDDSFQDVADDDDVDLPLERVPEHDFGTYTSRAEARPSDDLGGRFYERTEHDDDARWHSIEHDYDAPAPARHAAPEWYPDDRDMTHERVVERNQEDAQPASRFTLPDLDDLLTDFPVDATAFSGATGDRVLASSPGRDDLDAGSESLQSASPLQSAGSRWSHDSPPSPRESLFRARRFREWDHTHPASRFTTSGAPHHARGPEYAEADETTDVDSRMTSAPGSLPNIDATSFDLREVVERGGELLDMSIEIAPDVPRECRTCRSFRSADGGARGWCTNEWAFTHRRMVNEDDLACDATIGCWWLPSDRYWTVEDTALWSGTTPKMDAFLNRGAPSSDHKETGG